MAGLWPPLLLVCSGLNEIKKSRTKKKLIYVFLSTLWEGGNTTQKGRGNIDGSGGGCDGMTESLREGTKSERKGDVTGGTWGTLLPMPAWTDKRT